MIDFTKKCIEELSWQLDATEKVTQPPLIAHERRSDAILSCIKKVRDELRTYIFPSEDEEIKFFKNLLPKLLSLSIYYYEGCKLDCLQMLTTEKSQQESRDALLDKMDEFFKLNVGFVLYCGSEKTDMDQMYFLQNSLLNKQKKDLLSSVMDYSWCPEYTVILALSIAYGDIKTDFFLDGVTALKMKQSSDDQVKKLVWTGPKIDLIELIYSWKEMGVFNNGKATLKQIVKFCEEAFCVKLGNVTKAFQDIKNRKSGKPLFIDRAKAALEKAIDRDIKHGFYGTHNRGSLERDDFSLS